METKKFDHLPERASELRVEPQRNGEVTETFRAPELYSAHLVDSAFMRRLTTSLISSATELERDLKLLRPPNEQSVEMKLPKPETVGLEQQTGELIPQLVDPDDQLRHDKAKHKSFTTEVVIDEDKNADTSVSTADVDSSHDEDMNFDTYNSHTEDESSGDEDDGEGFVTVNNSIKVDFKISPTGASNILYATIQQTRGLDVIHIVDLKERTIKFITARRSIENTIHGDEGRRGLIVGMTTLSIPGRYEWAMGRVIDDGQKSGVWECVWPGLEHQLPEDLREQTVDIIVEEGDYSVKDWDWDIGGNHVPSWSRPQCADDGDHEMVL